MNELLNKLATLLFGAVAIIFISLMILASIPGKVMGEIHDGIMTTLHAIGFAIAITFFVFLAFSLAYGILHLRRMMQLQVIRDGKHGQQARAVAYGGQLTQLTDFSANPQGQIEYLTRVLALNQKIVQASHSVTKSDILPLPYEEEAPILQIAPTRPAHEYLHISDDYRPHADEFLSARKLIVGISGSGKSNSTATSCEELGRLDVPMVLADTENEYAPLCNQQWFPHGILADSRTVNAENATAFGRHILDQNLQVVLNLHDYAMEEGALVMVNLIAGLKEWQEERANERRIPCEFLLEEATTWLPQNLRESPLHGTETINQLQDAFFNDMVRKGRKRGLGLTVICQKIAEIDKRALQCEVKLLHRQTELIDLEKYNKMGITADETLQLQNGEGFYFSSQKSKLKIQVRRRHSEHGANTPGLAALRAYQKEARVSPIFSAPTLTVPLEDETLEPVTRVTEMSDERVTSEDGRAGVERVEPSLWTSQRIYVDGDMFPFELGAWVHANESPSETQVPLNQPVEQAEDSPETRPAYPEMDNVQVTQFIALYPLLGIEKALDRIPGCSHRHREHAREIIRRNNLKRKG